MSGSKARVVPKKENTEYKGMVSKKVKHLFEESLFLSLDIVEACFSQEGVGNYFHYTVMPEFHSLISLMHIQFLVETG